jgi:hypothetical protein
MHSPSLTPRLRIAAAAVAGLALLGGGARAESAAPPPPVDFDAGFDTRLRSVARVNLLDLDRGTDFNHDADPANDGKGLVSDAALFRVRHRLTGQLKLRSGPRLFTRLTAEWWQFTHPWRWNPSSGGKTEVIFDNLYLDLPALPYVPASLRVGRQDLMRGEGFVLLEGGPLDGSRSIYQNAILLGLDGAKLGLRKTKLELMAIRNLAWDPIPLANGASDADRAAGRRRILECDETAFGLYVTQTDLRQHALEGYYIYKEQDPTAFLPQRDGTAAVKTDALDLELHTVGARAAGTLPAQLRYAAEGAFQRGTQSAVLQAAPGSWSAPGSYDHRSFGAHAWVSRSFLLMFRPALKLGALYLSGDRFNGACNREDQSWVPVFSRWPEWSELYIYTLINERGAVAYWSNLSALSVSLNLQLTRALKLTYTYHHLRAPEIGAYRDAPGFGGGKVRGADHQWWFNAEMGSRVSGHILIERFAPGDFYAARDDAYFIRTELMLKK